MTTGLLVVGDARGLTSRETAILNQMNAARTGQGESAFSNQTTLYNCAKAWAQKMADAHTAKHDTNSALSSCAGSGWTTLGENVAMVPVNFDVVTTFMGSCGHRDNILTAGYSHVGVAMVLKNDIEFWVIRFGDRSSVASGPITTVQNGCMDVNLVTDGVSFSSVRTQGKWHTYHSSGGRANRAETSPGTPSANFIMRLDDPDPGTAQATQLVRGAAGKVYTLTAQALWLSGTAQALYLDFLDSNYTRISVKFVLAPTGDHSWKTVTTGAVTAPSGTAYVRVILYGASASGTLSVYYWDDVILNRQ